TDFNILCSVYPLNRVAQALSGAGLAVACVCFALVCSLCMPLSCITGCYCRVLSLLGQHTILAALVGLGRSDTCTFTGIHFRNACGILGCQSICFMLGNCCAVICRG